MSGMVVQIAGVADFVTVCVVDVGIGVHFCRSILCIDVHATVAVAVYA